MKQTKLLLLILAIFMPMMADADPLEVNGIWFDVQKDAQIATVVSGFEEYSGVVVIPSKVTYNGIVCNVTSIGERAFKDSSIESATLHVPKGCVEAYKAVEPWKNFKNIVLTNQQKGN